MTSSLQGDGHPRLVQDEPGAVPQPQLEPDALTRDCAPRPSEGPVEEPVLDVARQTLGSVEPSLMRTSPTPSW